jgi:hypothetical protein
VPQILLSGAIIKFDKLHYLVTTEAYVPAIGDMMPSRWGFEALMVNQFAENDYQKNFFAIEQEISDASFKSNYLIPFLDDVIEVSKNSQFKNKPVNYNFRIIDNELNLMLSDWQIKRPEKLRNFPVRVGVEELTEIKSILNKLKLNYSHKTNRLIEVKNAIQNKLIAQIGKENLVRLKNENINNRLNEFVLDTRELNHLSFGRNRIVRHYEPVYQQSESKAGRAQFYASYKTFGKYEVKTFWFNLGVLWFMSILLYVCLYFNWLLFVIQLFEQLIERLKLAG